VGSDRRLCDLLPVAGSEPGHRLEFTAELESLAVKLDPKQTTFSSDLLSNFLGWCSQEANRHHVPDTLLTAQKKFTSHRDTARKFHRTLAKLLGHDGQLKLFANVETVFVDARNFAYPTEFHWVCETPKIRSRWYEHILTAKLHDARQPRSPHFLNVNPSRLQYDCPPDKSLIFRDKGTRQIVGLVFRNICQDEDILQWADRIVCEVTAEKKSIRVSLVLCPDSCLELTASIAR
jgi:hypothetical protein